MSAPDLSEPREDREGEEYRRQIKFTKTMDWWFETIAKIPGIFNFNLTSVFFGLLALALYLFTFIIFMRNKFFK